MALPRTHSKLFKGRIVVLGPIFFTPQFALNLSENMKNGRQVLTSCQMVAPAGKRLRTSLI